MLFTLLKVTTKSAGTTLVVQAKVSVLSSESHCSGPRIPMSEVEQLRSRWSRLDPHMSPLSSLGVLTLALLSQDTLPGCSLLTGLVILVIECSAQQFKGTGEVSGSALVE